MTKDRSLVRASDIGQWTFCRRAWWLANVKGASHRNPAVLQKGTAVHDAHGRRVLTAQRLRQAGYLILLAALFLAGTLILFQLLVG